MTTKTISFRERLKNRKRLILFICTGNTCRSPMAAGYFRKLLDENEIKNVEVRSAGVMTITGLLASQEAIQVMENEGVDLRKHRSTQLTPELIHKASLILAMTPFHRQTALRMSEEAKDKTCLFKEFAKSDLKNVQIADPMGCTLEVFKKCFKEIKAACDKLVKHEYVAGPQAPVRKKPAETRSSGKGGEKKTPTRKTAKAGKPAKAAAKTAVKAKPAKAEAKPAAKSTRPAAKKAAPAKAPAKKKSAAPSAKKS